MAMPGGPENRKVLCSEPTKKERPVGLGLGAKFVVCFSVAIGTPYGSIYFASGSFARFFGAAFFAFGASPFVVSVLCSAASSSWTALKKLSV